MPSMPYMSPAAMGWIVVSPRGSPLAANRAPMARSVASGQPRPLEELMDTVAPLGISAAAASRLSSFEPGIAVHSRWVALGADRCQSDPNAGSYSYVTVA